MEEMIPIVVLVVLTVFGAFLALAVWLIVRAVNARNHIEELSLRIRELDFRIGELGSEIPRLKREREAAPSLKWRLRLPSSHPSRFLHQNLSLCHNRRRFP